MDSGQEKKTRSCGKDQVVDSCCAALSVGMVCSAPLTLLGELIVRSHNHNALWTVVGSTLTLPGTIYTAMTGVSAMSSNVSIGVYFITQVIYFTGLSLVLRLLFLRMKKTAVPDRSIENKSN